jgi:hypothetical protein
MKPTDVTYGQLDKALRSLGFSCRMLRKEPPVRYYEHDTTTASFRMPAFPMTDHVLGHHLVGVRTSLDLYGIADPDEFTARLKKAG